MNLVDTSGWLEYFFNGLNADYFALPIEKTERLIVPVVCLYEVFKKINHVGSQAQALHAIAQMKLGRVVNLTEDIALSAALTALCGVGAALAMGNATSKAVDAIARQPEAGGKINSSLMFGLILMETCAVYALLVGILIVFILGGKVA